MRLPITDKFLWDLCKSLGEFEDAYSLFSYPVPIKEILHPDFHQLKSNYRKRKWRKRFSKLIWYLKKKGLIKIKNLEGKEALLLTPLGTEKILRLKLKRLDKRLRKDRMWQMLIFDIPERKRKLRDILRWSLKALGYKMLQQSIWVCPYEVSKETEIVIRRYSLDPYIKIFLVKEI